MRIRRLQNVSWTVTILNVNVALQKADTFDALVKTFFSVQNIDLDTQEKNGNIKAVDFGNTDGVFFRGKDILNA